MLNSALKVSPLRFGRSVKCPVQTLQASDRVNWRWWRPRESADGGPDPEDNPVERANIDIDGEREVVPEDLAHEVADSEL